MARERDRGKPAHCFMDLGQRREKVAEQHDARMAGQVEARRQTGSLRLRLAQPFREPVEAGASPDWTGAGLDHPYALSSAQ